MDTSSPLVILGLDVGDPEAIEQWAREGHLPTIGSLMERGARGRVGGPELVCEHGTALSLFSGVSRAAHGYYYFRQLVPGTYDLKTVGARDAGTPPFWSSLRGEGLRVCVVDAVNTPAVAGLEGFQLANWAVHTPAAPASAEPAELLEEVSREFGPQAVVDEDYGADAVGEREIYRRLSERIEKKGELCRRLLALGPFDLVVVMFYEAHTASHQFWKYRGGGEFTNAVREVYRQIDRQMGLLLDALPRRANVCALSLFGMEDRYPTTGLIEDFCRRLGYHVAAPLAPTVMSVARRVVPKGLRVALSRFLPAARQERLLADGLRGGTDWSKTTAFAIPSLYTSFVRVNLAGREPEGVVRPGAEYESLLDRLEADLRLLTDAETGRAAVSRVTRTAAVFGGGPPRQLPDLFVEWAAGPRFVRRVEHPSATLTQQRPAFCPGSEESLQGFFAAAGPGVPAGRDLGEISLLDLAPTFLALLGRKPPAEMTGRVLEGWAADAHAAHAVRSAQ